MYYIKTNLEEIDSKKKFLFQFVCLKINCVLSITILHSLICNNRRNWPKLKRHYEVIIDPLINMFINFLLSIQLVKRKSRERENRSIYKFNVRDSNCCVIINSIRIFKLELSKYWKWATRNFFSWLALLFSWH